MAKREVGELAEWLGVTVQTVRRWCRGHPIPRATQIALLHLLGEIEGLPGFHVDETGRLWTPTSKRGFAAAELENWAQVHRAFEATRRELEELRANVARLPHRAEPKPAHPHRRRFARRAS